jgi:hypothetical protein
MGKLHLKLESIVCASYQVYIECNIYSIIHISAK